MSADIRLKATWGGTRTSRSTHDAIIDGCLAGERKAQEQLYERFYGKMLAVCLRYTKNHDQAKDILQDGFIKVFHSLEQFQRDGSFEGWIRRIMVNTAIDYFRRSRHSHLLLGENQDIEAFEDITAEEEPAATALEGNLKPADVINAMQKLTPAYRTVFNLYVFEDMTHKQIAETLGINIGTSKSNLAKAKARLRQILTGPKAE